MQFHVCRAAVAAARDAPADAETVVPSVDELDLATLDEWTDKQLAGAWTGGLLQDLPDEVWDRLAEDYAASEDKG